jgi:hypothetical protein
LQYKSEQVHPGEEMRIKLSDEYLSGSVLSCAHNMKGLLHYQLAEQEFTRGVHHV